jgi:hypothetical protein
MRHRPGLLWIAALSGCGNSTSVADATATLAGAFCERIVQCCTGGQIACTAGHAITRDECVALVQLSLRAQTDATAQAVTAGRRRVDSDALDACVDAIAQSGCYPFASLEACTESVLFPGTQGDGEVCLDSSECQDGTWCYGLADGGQGVCVRLQAEGELCYDSSQCRADLYCAAEGYVCQPRSEAGGPCEADEAGAAEAPLCAAGTTCNPSTERCEGPAAEGESCASRACREGLFCGFSDNRFSCQAPLPDGEACVSDFQCASGHCDGGGHCATDANECSVGVGLIGIEACTP